MNLCYLLSHPNHEAVIEVAVRPSVAGAKKPCSGCRNWADKARRLEITQRFQIRKNDKGCWNKNAIDKGVIKIIIGQRGCLDELLTKSPETLVMESTSRRVGLGSPDRTAYLIIQYLLLSTASFLMQKLSTIRYFKNRFILLRDSAYRAQIDGLKICRPSPSKVSARFTASNSFNIHQLTREAQKNFDLAKCKVGISYTIKSTLMAL